MREEMVFRLPTKIVFGPKRLDSLGEIIRNEFRAGRLMLVTDPGIVGSGIADRVLSQVKEVNVFDEVEPNPKAKTVDRAGEIAREVKPELVIGLGGGSPLDAAKAVALLAVNGGKIEEYEGREKYRVPPLPVLAIPTTCGTGSEVTWVAVVSHTERCFKMSIKGPLLFPSLALIDPDLLVTLPPSLVASTGMDALTHAVEAYTVKGATFFTDLFARRSIELIFSSLERAYRDIRNDAEARGNMMLGSTLAGVAFGNSDVGAVHCLAEAVGGLLDLPHGLLNSVFLPYVMEYNITCTAEKYSEIAGLVGIDERDKTRASLALIEEIKGLSRSLKIPSFQELGIEEKLFPEIARKSFENNSNPSNPRQANVEDYEAILRRASRQQ